MIQSQNLNNVYQYRQLSNPYTDEQISELPILNADFLLFYGLYLGIKLNLIVIDKEKNKNQDNHNRIKTITRNDYLHTTTCFITPHQSIISYRSGLYQVIENKSNYTIQIKEYAPQAFLFFRELLAISYKHILQFIEMNWNELSYELSSFHLLSLQQKQKTRLLKLLPSLIIVRNLKEE